MRRWAAMRSADGTVEVEEEVGVGVGEGRDRRAAPAAVVVDGVAGEEDAVEGVVREVDDIDAAVPVLANCARGSFSSPPPP